MFQCGNCKVDRFPSVYKTEQRTEIKGLYSKRVIKRDCCCCCGSQHNVSTKSAQQISALHSIQTSGLYGWSPSP